MAEKTTTTTEAAIPKEFFSALIDELKTSREEQTKLAKQTAPRKQNDFPPLISTFNPRGDKDFPLPDLKCQFFIPFKVETRDNTLDREEVELLNLMEPGEYTVELLDGSVTKVDVRAKRNIDNNTIEQMRFESVMYTGDKRAAVPPLRVLCRQMLGARAKGVFTMAEERSLIAAGDLAVSVGE